jgi:glucose-1-phosphate adenylyltransferase
MLPHVQVGRHCVLKKCIVDKNCVLPEGTVIGLNPAQDKKRFRVTDSGITLVTREMLGQAEKGIR